MIEKVLVVVIIGVVGAYAQGSCRTDQHEMTCRGKNSLHDLKKDQDYLEVDTLNVHQAKLDLTDDLVPDGINLSHLTLLNATDNQITRIGRRGFDKIRNMQFLYLSINQISHSQPDPFQALEKLKRLEMNDALDGNMEEKSDMLRNFFHSKNSFVHLAQIELNKNKIEGIYPKTFCGIQGLQRLELSNNRIPSFDFARTCLKELKALMLAGNLIQKIPADIWDFLPSLSSLDISNNPIDCDCATIRLLSGDDVVFLNQADTKCASPPELEGKRIFELSRDYCKTTRNPRGKASFFQFLVLFVIAVGILWLYKKYRERTRHMSSVPVGYTNLQHEQAVEPEFV
ncbi:LRRCT domain-containing protein [Caenorhabditis elegans]|uniref:LRRCT domain-containing protein n=1 Tax=Caenorhabditis elegans TaxID=6239 RepID=Q9N5D7_CAEEL|nr:LRRCT domain-containing protein [Caenorhabditis elegans]CCD61914.1 LRRCT domain-containing protein [Caenorhabditis elegans]|eukprot:NP_491676.2 eLRR (extracellular Leucine-Rich Repeat) ONly [Caenorhabditis elegans]